MTSSNCLMLLILCVCGAGALASVERVKTREQLVDALKRRVQHIVLTDHMDLTTLPLSAQALNKEALVVQYDLSSITVRTLQPNE
jgi:hypothetical protein